MSALSRRGVCWCWFAVASLVVGCSSKSMTPAPVEDREMAAVKVAPVVDVKPPVVKQPPGFENAGKPGYYTVKAGDTLIRIGLEHGQSHRDLTRWNNLENPNKIEVGQVLRVQAPVLTETGAETRPVVTSSVSASPIPAIGTATATAGSTAVTPGKASNGMVAAPSPAASTPAP
ncbi:MAG: LysM peptidoglycan-binding domain-containing protein, partial [Rhodoferax sp.]|nr:LysM peptidoglycan-binding domain-containing protein [Rhodoferax sp.]